MKKGGRYLVKILVAIVLSFLGFNSFSQDLDRALNIYGKAMEYQYTKPNRFLELDSGTFMRTNACIFKTKTGKVRSILLSAPFSYSIISERKDIVITFMISEGSMFDSLDYEQDLRLYADTVNHCIIRYSKRYLVKTSRATSGSLYVPRCPNLYTKEYPNIKIVILHKEGKGTIQMFYYYKDQASNRIRKCIRRTVGMIKFDT